MDIKQIKKVHFVGIGGIGVSAIARMMLFQGKKVSGSDNSTSEITTALEKEGAKIFSGHDIKNIDPAVDLVVYTAAISKDNVEIAEAKKRNLPVLSYSETLGIVSKDKKVIAVSGTHGKTTTTAMIAEVLIKAGIDPTVVVGSLLKNPHTNFISGKGKYFVTEADEYKKSFLSLSPYILIITNIDLDHLDFYKDLSDIQEAFSDLVKKIPKEGALICDCTNPHLSPVIKNAKCRVVDYKTQDLAGLKLQVPGKHNRENAQVTLALSSCLNISRDNVLNSLNNFTGAWRRFEFKGKTKSGALVYDDYAHNPQKVEAVILGAKEMFPNQRVVAVFQPHLYSRTKLFLNDFAKALSQADCVVVAPIYGAREVLDQSISSGDLVKKVKNTLEDVSLVSNLDNIPDFLAKILKKNDVCILIGAGNIYTVSPKIVV